MVSFCSQYLAKKSLKFTKDGRRDIKLLSLDASKQSTDHIAGSFPYSEKSSVFNSHKEKSISKNVALHSFMKPIYLMEILAIFFFFY